MAQEALRLIQAQALRGSRRFCVHPGLVHNADFLRGLPAKQKAVELDAGPIQSWIRDLHSSTFFESKFMLFHLFLLTLLAVVLEHVPLGQVIELNILSIRRAKTSLIYYRRASSNL